MDYDRLLNEEQIKPVEDTEGQILVLAGAGSGKTRVLTYRIAYLVERMGVHPYNILAITFTNKAAGEMKERLADLLGTNVKDMWISTFHSMCNRILRCDISKLGYDSNYSIYTESDSDKLLLRILRMMGIDDVNFKKIVRCHISNAKSHALAPKEYYKKCKHPKADVICKIFGWYEEELRKCNALDFDDLMLKTIELFMSFPEVLRKYQERFRYVLVDEFQDTDKVQYLLVRLLSKVHGNLFVVGDDDQSIYGWRGADVGNILNFKKDYPATRIYKLQRNYRSTGNILKCANNVISNNKARMGKELWTDVGDGLKVTFRNSYDDRQEADYVLKEINGLIRNNGYKPGDFAILVRVNRITRVFEERMNLYGIPYKVYGGFKFYERKEIKDAIAYLRMLSNPADTESILRIINMPKRGIGDTVVTRMLTYAGSNNLTLYDVIMGISENTEFTAASVRKVEGFRELVVKLKKALGEMPLDRFVDYMMEVVDFSQTYDKEIPDEANKLDNIDEFVTSVKQFYRDNSEHTTLDEYLQSLSLVSDTDDINSGDSLTLATIHGVKGLEYRCVFIVGLEEGIFPGARAKDSPEEMEEERRIMYVAVTRARERLYLTNATQRYIYGRLETNMTSRFVTECGVIDLGGGDYRRVAPEAKEDTRYVLSRGFTERIQESAKRTGANEKDISVFKVGQKVRHGRFGEGVILGIQGENGNIEFPKLGVKMFNLRLAPIEIID